MKARQIIYQPKLIGSICLAQLVIFSPQPRAENEYIDKLLEGGTTLSLVALNPISGDLLKDSTSLESIKIDKAGAESIIRSQIPVLHDWKFDRKFTEDEIDSIYKRIIDKNNTIVIPATEGIPVIFLDAYSTLNMYNNGLIITSESGSALEFNPKYIDGLKDIYFSYAQSYHTATNAEKASYINDALYKISMNPILDSAVNADVGTVTFGMPMFSFIRGDKLSASIKNTLKEHFFMSIEFAYSVQLSDFYNAETIDFIFQLPDGCIAVGLFPWIEYIENREETTTRIPSISIKVLGLGAEIGTIFEKKNFAAYRYPAILPFGIYEQNFSWKIKDKAVREGPFILVPIIACPNSMKEIKINRLVSINYRSNDPFIPHRGPAFQQNESFILINERP